MDHYKNIDVLLDLDGIIIEQAGGYWVKFEARQLPVATEQIPHCIRYSLTLHNKEGTRVMGFDNAHAVKIRKTGKHRARKTYDHRHRHAEDQGVPYEFNNAHQLIKDFWMEVDQTLNLLGVDVGEI
jgi:hypothetical protein